MKGNMRKVIYQRSWLYHFSNQLTVKAEIFIRSPGVAFSSAYFDHSPLILGYEGNSGPVTLPNSIHT